MPRRFEKPAYGSRSMEACETSHAALLWEYCGLQAIVVKTHVFLHTRKYLIVFSWCTVRLP
jgi:hypothetical protein